MRIGELGSSVNVGIETIRYYEKIGLLPEPCRSPNGYRTYTSVHLERLAFIRHCRMLDIPISEIKLILDSSQSKLDMDCSEINQLIDKQLTRVRARLVSMKRLEKQLLALRACCEEEHVINECGILHELEQAARGEECACHSDTRKQSKGH